MPRSRKKTKIGGGGVAATTSSRSNPLLEEQRAFLGSTLMCDPERESFFDPNAVSPTRRAEIWAAQAALGEQLINQYAWATPSEPAIRILKYFSPIVEMGCGANAYWCRQMQAAGVDCLGYDVAPDRGGLVPQDDDEVDPIKQNRKQAVTNFRVRTGGPDVLTRHSDRTLFLCYPDEGEICTEAQEESREDPNIVSSMAAECLQHYKGDYVIHVGELLATGSCLAQNDQSPWGRSSSAEFQERLATEFHCVLCLELPNWLHTRDRLTVWKRSKTTTIVFAGDDDDDDDSDEEVEYRHIPVEERLPVNLAAPFLQHLFEATTDDVKEHATKNVEKNGDTKTTIDDAKAKLEGKEPEPSVRENSMIESICSTTELPLSKTDEQDSDHNKSARKSKKKKRKKTQNIAGAADGSKEQEYACPW